MSLRVFGVVMHDGHAGGAPKPPAGTQLHVVRDLAAVWQEGDYSARAVEAQDIERHLDVVQALFRQDPVLPTPVGTVFRTADVLQRWMELHYVALSDALAWVEDRVGARVHITRGDGGAKDSNAELAVIALEVMRSLRRKAVASVPLRTHETPDDELDVTTGFLVEGELWNEFADAIGDEQERHAALRIALTGPWPPYDFVRLQFGV